MRAFLFLLFLFFFQVAFCEAVKLNDLKKVFAEKNLLKYVISGLMISLLALE